MVGNAVFTTEMSSTTRICAINATARTDHDRRSSGAGSGWLEWASVTDAWCGWPCPELGGTAGWRTGSAVVMASSGGVGDQ